MNCEKVREQLLDVLDGHAPAETGAHVDACAACAGKLAELRQTMALLDEWKAPEVSPYFDARLQARLREQQHAPTRGWFAWFGLKPAAAALAVLLVAGIGLLNTGDLRNTRTVPPDTTAGIAAYSAAVSDLETLDENEELLADFELLDTIEEQHENGS